MGLALLGLVIVICGPLSYLLLLDRPYLRRSGLLIWVLMGAGTALTLLAAQRDGRGRVRGVAGAAGALTGLAVVMFYGLAALPAPTVANSLELAPEFALVDHTGREVSLAGLRAAGPVLLVFYRGHW